MFTTALRRHFGITQHVQSHLDACQMLPKTVVKFTRDAPPLRILSHKQTAGKQSQLLVHLSHLLGFPMQPSEHFDLGAQEFGNNWNRDVIDSSAFVSLEPVQILM